MNERWLAAGLVTLSLALLAVWTWLRAKPLHRRRSDNRPERLVRGAPGQAVRFFYFVGLPYLAIITGLLTPRSLGLKGLEYFSLINPAGYSAAAFSAELEKVAVLMLLEWLVDSRTVIIAGLLALAIFKGVLAHLARYGVELDPAPTPLETTYDSLHWSFYRALFWLITGDLYLAVILGCAWVLLEWLLAARLQGARSLSAPVLIKAIILVLTSTVFFYSLNWWLLLPVHLLMAAMVKQSSHYPDAIPAMNSTKRV